eukprot:NODE_780_length_3936_cov_0.468335.p4 type:complete len:112 gc:universal NODE_780_length_3936_cov_0.468335:1759-1424(-)
MGGITDRYMRFEAAGNQYVGRTVSGVPLQQAECTSLPPFFTERNDLLSRTLRECFPNMPANMAQICEFALASVVYHKDFLLETLPASHSLFRTSVFRHVFSFKPIIFLNTL